MLSKLLHSTTDQIGQPTPLKTRCTNNEKQQETKHDEDAIVSIYIKTLIYCIDKY